MGAVTHVAPRGDSPRVLGGLELPFFPGLGLERRLRFRWKSLLSVAENTKVCKSSLRGGPALLSRPFSSGSISSSLNQTNQVRQYGPNRSPHFDRRTVRRRILSISAKCPASIIRSASSNTRNLRFRTCCARTSSWSKKKKKGIFSSRTRCQASSRTNLFESVP